jgi:hypothetical protein
MDLSHWFLFFYLLGGSTGQFTLRPGLYGQMYDIFGDGTTRWRRTSATLDVRRFGWEKMAFYTSSHGNAGLPSDLVSIRIRIRDLIPPQGSLRAW